MIFRIYHLRKGDHVHMRVFAGERDKTLAKCGDLVMRKEEFTAFKRWLTPRVQFVDDDPRGGT